jgi:hypothetical protein
MDDLGRLQADLRRLPRHQWDRYLWDFCRRFVQRQHAALGDARHTAPDDDEDDASRA